MQSHFLKKLVYLIPILLLMGRPICFAQKQDFENNFQEASFPDEFLPGWYGNEVRSTSARIFQLPGQGIGGSKALAVQPIASFDGKIWIRLAPSSFSAPELLFFAKTIQNGSGTRPALVFYSWGKGLEGAFSAPIQLGTDGEFPNQNRDFQQYRLDLPDSFKELDTVYLSLDIRYGPGTGSAARWVMDDFEFGDIEIDETPPKIAEVKGYDGKSIRIRFSEKVDPVFSILPPAYNLAGQNPDQVVLEDDSVAVITFSQNLQQARQFSLSIRQIPDLEGNFLQDTTIAFTFYDPTDIPFKKLVINELMPSPRTDQDLPNVEYIELFNAGEKELRLAGMKLANSRSATSLTEFWIKPGEYLLLAPENQAAQLGNFGQVLPVKSWPTLLNSGDEISLFTKEEVVIDQISYSTSTWGGSDLANGGYSLEVPNPFFLCDNSLSLKPSEAAARGTPGKQNSVYDISTELPTPTLAAAYFKDSVTIAIVFSTPVLTDLTVENAGLDPFLPVDSLSFVSSVEVLIHLGLAAVANQIYRLELTGLLNCLGNEIEPQFMDIVLPESPKMGDLVINEVLFNPRSGDPKFVEIKNSSEVYLDLEGYALANINAAGEVDQVRIFGNKGLILFPGAMLAITTDANALRLTYPKSIDGNFLQITSLPSYPIGGGTVVLLLPTGELAESFEYSDDLHHPLLRDPKGVSLERVSSDSPAAVESNWQSASANEEYATPGRKNSQSLETEFESELIQIDPEVFDPEGSSGPAFATIRYQLNSPGWIGTFKIYSSAGVLVQVLAQNQIMSTEGLMSWSGTDSTGKQVRAGYYLLIAELYEPNGGIKVIKKTIVVASRLK